MIKYLGVTLDNKLTFRHHIQDKAKIATTVLNMLRRNLFFAPKSVKSKAYQACVQPILEYASLCWTPTSQKQKNSLEKIHHNAAKFATNTYPKKGNFQHFLITKVLKNLNWSSLETRREEARLCMAYKIINGHVILQPGKLPKSNFNQSLRSCNEAKVGAKNQLNEPPNNRDIAGYTFFYATPKLWNNSVTAAQAKSPSIDALRKHFRKKSS